MKYRKKPVVVESIPNSSKKALWKDIYLQSDTALTYGGTITAMIGGQQLQENGTSANIIFP